MISMMLQGCQSDLLVGAELLRGVSECKSNLLHGCPSDLVVGAELLRGAQQ